MRVNHIFLQGWMICLWIIWVLWGCQTRWDGEGWGNGRRGKLSILSGMSGCLIKGVMTERSAGERKTFWEHTQVWGICKGFWIKTNRKNLICQQLPVFDPLVILSMSVFFQSCWALPKGSTSTTKTQMGKRSACMYVFVCLSETWTWSWVSGMQWKSHCFLIDMQIVFSLHRMTHSRITRMYWQNVLQSFYLTLCFPIMFARAWSKMILYIHLDSFWLPPEVYRRSYLYSCSLRLQSLYGKQWLETTEQHYWNHIQSKWLLWRCASGLRPLLFSCCLQSDFGASWWWWIRNKTVKMESVWYQLTNEQG